MVIAWRSDEAARRPSLKVTVARSPLRATNDLTVNFDEAAISHIVEHRRKALAPCKTFSFNRISQYCVEQLASGTDAPVGFKHVANKLIDTHGPPQIKRSPFDSPLLRSRKTKEEAPGDR